MRFRNNYEAFNGDITIGEDRGDGTLTITWKKDNYYTALTADFKELTYQIVYYDEASGRECILIDFIKYQRRLQLCHY